MKIKHSRSISLSTSVIVVPFFENAVDQEMIKDYSGIRRQVDFKGKAKEVFSILHPERDVTIHIVGIGNNTETSTVWRNFRSIMHKLKSNVKGELAIDCNHLGHEIIFQIVHGIVLAMRKQLTYKADHNNEEAGIKQVKIIHDNVEIHGLIDKALKLAEVQIGVMSIVDTPGNFKNPEFMYQQAFKMVSGNKVSCKIYREKELASLGMHALLSVGQGSLHKSAMIVLEYKGVTKKSGSGRIGLVGKGITFDTGGISIKPSANMGYMKSDMAGGAAVIGAVTVAASLKLPLHIIGVIPIAENSVDACSIRPGDVISSYSGKTIEVIDTDAEGRLILADALSYLIKKYNPETIVDLATLTGNCIQILGSAGAGLFTKNDHLAKELLDAGTSTDEKLWALPLWEEYASEMQSDIADIKNLSTKPVAGAITAAKFLEVFTKNHSAWAHIDIAGVAFTDNEFSRQRNATAFGVALLTRFFENRVGKTVN